MENSQLPRTGIIHHPRRKLQPWTVRHKGYTIRFCRDLVEADDALKAAIDNGNGKKGH